MVRDGLADIGAVNSVVVDAMLRDGRLRPDDIRILWKSPPFADYVWAVRSEFSEATTNRLRNSFLALSHRNLPHAEILNRLGAQMFLPASIEDFDQLTRLYSELSKAQSK